MEGFRRRVPCVYDTRAAFGRFPYGRLVVPWGDCGLWGRAFLSLPPKTTNMGKTFTVALILMALLFTAKAQQTDSTAIRLKALETKIAYSGTCMKRYHQERKMGYMVGGISLAVSAAPIYEGIKDGNPGFTGLGVAIGGAGVLFLAVKVFRAERWLKRAGVEMSGDGMRFVF
jgi:hypothetical protein